MVFVKEYYQITPRKTSDVAVGWKVVHTLIFIGIAAFGFEATFMFGKSFSTFNFNCILFADLVFKNITDNSTDFQPLAEQNLSRIDYQHTQWGQPMTCNFVQFMPLMSMISGVIWITFFITLARGGRGDPGDLFLNPWRIIAPALVFCTLMLIPAIMCHSYAQTGYDKFCSHFEDIFGDSECNDRVDIYTTQFLDGKRGHFFSYIQLALVSVKLGLYLWIAQVAVLVIRIVMFADFQVNRIKVSGRGDAEKVKFLQAQLV